MTLSISILSRKRNRKILVSFTRRMATLLDAGVPLLRSLALLQKQESNTAFKQVVGTLHAAVEGGSSLSDALRQYPAVFDRLYINMIRAGETAGTLETVLNRLANYHENRDRIWSQIRTASVYPIIVMIVAAVIVSLLTMIVVPKFEMIYHDVLGGVEMPGLTRLILSTSTFFRGNFILLTLVTTGFIILIRMGRCPPVVSRKIDLILFKVPALGDLVKKLAVARFSRTFATLSGSGVPLLDSLKLSRDTVDNTAIQSALDFVYERVRDGESMALPMDQSGVFPEWVTSMVEVGEETGRVDGMLNRIADTYEEDLNRSISTLTSVIEPLMIIFLALVIGTIVIGLFLPIIGIIENLGAH